MSGTFNVYCDESCHLENDGHKVMILGAVWCPVDKSREIADRIREIKAKHRVDREHFEIKWTKVSPAKRDFYLDLLDYFFDDDDLHFRALIVADKTRLDHKAYNQTHDGWYYKMYFALLKNLLHPTGSYNVYLDIKDTCGAEKIRKLHEVLASSRYDFRHTIIQKLQTVRSHEVQQLQLADLLIGTVGYANRALKTNSGKTALVERMRKRSRYDLTRTTLLREDKVNIFRWTPSGPDREQ